MNKLKRKIIDVIVISFTIIVAILICGKVSGNDNKINLENKDYVEGEAIVILKSNKKFTTLSAMKSNLEEKSIWDELTVYKELDFENKDNKEYSVASSENNNIASSENDGEIMKYLFVKSEKYTTEEIIDNLKNEGYYVQPNYKYHVNALTNDTYLKHQWAIENIGQFGGTSGKDINPVSEQSDEEKVIAVLDTGIDYNNEDLKDVMWKDENGNTGYDFVNDDTDPMDDFKGLGHGTSCAGVIAASSNNEKGITGALLENSNIKIMNIKIADEQGDSNTARIIEAYNYILGQQEKGVDIIATNMSLGGEVQEGNDIATSEVINRAGENGTLSICAAGNETMDIDNKNYFPAVLDSDYIISVAATDQNDKFCKSFSNYGKKEVDLAAPGINILTTTLKSDICPLMYTEEQMNDIVEFYCGYDSKTDVVEGEDYCDSATDENGEVVNSNVNVEVTDENFFGAEGKSLKFTKKDLAGPEEATIILPIKVEKARKVYSNI